MRAPILLITALTPAVWGTTYVVTTEFLPPGRPLLAGVLRALPAGLLLIALTGRLPKGAWWWRSAVLGALNIGIFFAMLFVSAYRLPGGMAAVLGAAQPLVVAALTRLLLTERVATRTVVAGMIGAGGVTLAVLTAAAGLDAVGIIAGLTGTASMALGLVLTKRWGRPEVPLLTSTGWQLAAGGALLAPVALTVEGLPGSLTSANLAGYAYLSLIGTAVAYSVWFWGLERLPAARVSLLGLLSPIVATALGWAVLDQHLTPTQLAGMVIALGAVVWGQRSAQVRVVHDVLGEAGAGGPEHGSADPVSGRDVVRGDALEQGDQRPGSGIDRVVPAGLRPYAVGRLDHRGTEGIAVRQQIDDVSLGTSLDPGPHQPAVDVRARAGDVDEGRLRVELGEDARRGHREFVRDTRVGGLVHADRGDTEAVEAGVAGGQVVANRREVGEVVDPYLVQLRVGDAGRRAGRDEHLLDVRCEQTLAQDALADHAGRAEDGDLHRISPSVGVRAILRF
jgi:probable blue pigment (indigoidine) exporter